MSRRCLMHLFVSWTPLWSFLDHLIILPVCLTLVHPGSLSLFYSHCQSDVSLCCQRKGRPARLNWSFWLWHIPSDLNHTKSTGECTQACQSTTFNAHTHIHAHTHTHTRTHARTHTHTYTHTHTHTHTYTHTHTHTHAHTHTHTHTLYYKSFSLNWWPLILRPIFTNSIVTNVTNNFKLLINTYFHYFIHAFRGINCPFLTVLLRIFFYI